MEKGDWARDLMDACGFDSNSSRSSSKNDEPSFSAVYCGVSAGSILMGESMQTACWKVSLCSVMIYICAVLYNYYE